jgi:hypothetical protein
MCVNNIKYRHLLLLCVVLVLTFGIMPGKKQQAGISNEEKKKRKQRYNSTYRARLEELPQAEQEERQQREAQQKRARLAQLPQAEQEERRQRRARQESARVEQFAQEEKEEKRQKRTRQESARVEQLAQEEREERRQRKVQQESARVEQLAQEEREERRQRRARQEHARVEQLPPAEREEWRQGRAQQERKRAREFRENCKVTIDLTEDELQRHLNGPNGKDKFWDDSMVNPYKAMVLRYLNAGHGRFKEYREYDQAYNGQPVDLESLNAEIEAEQLTQTELTEILKKWFTHHSFTQSDLFACAACGKRETEQPGRPYDEHYLHDDLEVLRYSEEDETALRNIIASGEKLLLPKDESGSTFEVEPWKVRSVYDDAGKHFYHLHPELVESNPSGQVREDLGGGAGIAIPKQDQKQGFVLIAGNRYAMGPYRICP